MAYPDFIASFPKLDVPFPEDVVTCNAIRSDAGLVVFFHFLQDVSLPPHSHKAQWGTLVEGSASLTIGGVTKTYGPGDSWDIPDGVEHSVTIKAGSRAIDVFAEPDRYPLKP